MINKKTYKKLLLLTVLLLVSIVIFARPGGGHSYSGGSSFGGGGSYGGGGDGGLLFMLFYLLPPEISIPLIIIIVIFAGVKNRKDKTQDFEVVSTPTYNAVQKSTYQVSNSLAKLKAIDPNFSRVLFIDFVWLLYTKFYAYQNDNKKLLSIQPYFDKTLLQQLIKEQNAFTIDEIVIGNITITGVVIGEKEVVIKLNIKSNMTIEAEGSKARYIIDENWTLARDRSIQSPEPEKMKALRCPACGAPADFTDSGYCNYCDTLVVPGSLHWYLKKRTIDNMEVIKTKSLVSYSVERGTNLPTIKDPYLHKRMAIFANNHNINWEEYWQKFNREIVYPYFDEIYKAWEELKWERIRHLTGDRLWESYKFWIDTYKEKGLRNILKVKIERTEAAKIEIDRYYEAITVRIFASGLDYVVDQRGRIVGGSNKIPRRFSEYWTFIRRSGVEKDGYDIKKCPNCGAPVENINQQGICEYCGSKITDGDFSWVLAIIVQDEEYKG